MCMGIRWDFYTFSVHCVMSNVSCVTWKCRQSQCQVNINFLAVSVFNFSSNKNATRQIFNVLCTHMHTCYYAVYYIFYITAGVRFFYVSIKCFSLTSFHSPKSHTYSHARTHTSIAFFCSSSSVCNGLLRTRASTGMAYHLGDIIVSICNQI